MSVTVRHDEVGGSETALLDQVRAYWNSRPCNIRHSPQPVGSRQYFDEVEARKYFVEPHIPGFAQFDRWNGKNVLEIGCGIGTDTVNFARAGARVTAVDLSSASVDMCRRRLALFGLEANLYVGNAEELASFLPAKKYDLVYSFGVIHHTPDPARVVSQIRQYSHPDTEVRLMLYSKWSWKTLAILLADAHGKIWRWNEFIRQNSEAQTGCPVTFVYSRADLHQLLDGFRILEIRKEHIFPYKVEKYVNYEYERLWYFRVLPAGLFRWLEHRLGWHSLVVARPV